MSTIKELLDTPVRFWRADDVNAAIRHGIAIPLEHGDVVRYQTKAGEFVKLRISTAWGSALEAGKDPYRENLLPPLRRVEISDSWAFSLDCDASTLLLIEGARVRIEECEGEPVINYT